jgi:hypothetical protein
MRPTDDPKRDPLDRAGVLLVVALVLAAGAAFGVMLLLSTLPGVHP